MADQQNWALSWGQLPPAPMPTTTKPLNPNSNVSDRPPGNVLFPGGFFAFCEKTLDERNAS